MRNRGQTTKRGNIRQVINGKHQSPERPPHQGATQGESPKYQTLVT